MDVATPTFDAEDDENNKTLADQDEKSQTYSRESASSWDAHALEQVQAWVKLAELNSACNELASIFYNRMFKLATLLISVLTVLVGSKGLAILISKGPTPAEIFIAVCEVCLGISATIITNLELKNKSTSFIRRSNGYKKLASQLRVQLILHPEERARKLELLRSIPQRVAVLEELAEPLPLRYRVEADRVRSHTTGLWTLQQPVEVKINHDLDDRGKTRHYNATLDEEGNPQSLVQTIIRQSM
jgi:hypothetical protein